MKREERYLRVLPPLFGNEYPKYVPPRVEVPFQSDSDTLSGQRRFGEVAVVGFAVCFQAYVSTWGQQPLQVEVADEVTVRIGAVISVTEISVDEQAVVEQPSGEQSFYVHVAPSRFARAEVRPDVPVAVVAEQRGKHLVELPAQSRGQQ